MTDSNPHASNGSRQSPMEEIQILKESSDRDFQELSALAAQICASSMAGILVLQRGENWLKSFIGSKKSNFPVKDPNWAKLMEKKEFFEVDARDFRGSPEVPRGPLYVAATPLITADGHKIGFLFVADPKALSLHEDQKRSLEILSRQILNLIESQRQQNKLISVQKKLEQRYRELEKFSSVVSHDIKSPLANIISLTELLQEENKDTFEEETKQYLNFLAQASYSLRNYVDGILTFYRSDKILEKEEEDVELGSFFKNITDLYRVNRDVEISYPHEGSLKKVNKAALTQIFLNLISNSLKHNSKPHRWVEITFQETQNHYQFEVRDNGNGIPEKDFQRIFELFTTLDLNDRDGNPGSGIGLATVQKLVEHMGGRIEVASVPGEGSTFKFSILKIDS